AFHHAELAAYGADMVAHTARMMERFADGAVIDVDSDMAALTLGIVVRSLFGGDVTRDAAELGRLMVSVLDAANQRLNSVVRLPSWVPTSRNRREQRSLVAFDRMLRSLIEARRASGDGRHDLLSMLLAATDEDSGIRMSDRQLRDEMMTLFLAGHETT